MTVHILLKINFLLLVSDRYGFNDAVLSQQNDLEIDAREATTGDANFGVLTKWIFNFGGINDFTYTMCCY